VRSSDAGETGHYICAVALREASDGAADTSSPDSRDSFRRRRLGALQERGLAAVVVEPAMRACARRISRTGTGVQAVLDRPGRPPFIFGEFNIANAGPDVDFDGAFPEHRRFGAGRAEGWVVGRMSKPGLSVAGCACKQRRGNVARGPSLLARIFGCDLTATFSVSSSWRFFRERPTLRCKHERGSNVARLD
jgi:hypothetical protein